MLLLDRLQEILILHRKLDYADEDATLEEQSEKILYFYSSNLDARDIKEQLSIATLSEALIELTNKFSNEPIQTVVMHRKFWTFMECEPGIWIIIAFINIMIYHNIIMLFDYIRSINYWIIKLLY